MKISLATLSKRQDDVLEVLNRNEKILISYNGQVVAVLQSPGNSGRKDTRAFTTPAFGMWADREDMADPNEWRRGLRKKRRNKDYLLHNNRLPTSSLVFTNHRHPGERRDPEDI